MWVSVMTNRTVPDAQVLSAGGGTGVDTQTGQPVIQRADAPTTTAGSGLSMTAKLGLGALGVGLLWLAFGRKK